MKIFYTLILISATSFAFPLYKVVSLYEIQQQEMRKSFAQLVSDSQYLQKYHDELDADKKQHWFFYSMQRIASTLQQYEKNEFLSIAATTGYCEFVKLFIDAGAEIDHTTNGRCSWDDDNNDTPLHEAVRHGTNIDTILLLLENGASAHSATRMGRTPLHLAMLGYTRGIPYERYQTKLKKIQLLLEHGALINAPDINGDTPLHLAVLHTGSHVVRFLLRNGADMHARNNKGETPFDVAKKRAPSYIAQDILHVFMHYTSRCTLL